MIARWESVDRRQHGAQRAGRVDLRLKLGSGAGFYYLCLALCVAATLGCSTCCARRTGRAFVAIRDSEISAQCMGIDSRATRRCRSRSRRRSPASPARCTRTSWRSSRPTSSASLQSIELLLVVVVGGLGSVHGAFLGAIFLIVLPQLIALSKDWLPPAIGQASGLQG